MISEPFGLAGFYDVKLSAGTNVQSLLLTRHKSGLLEPWSDSVYPDVDEVSREGHRIDTVSLEKETVLRAATRAQKSPLPGKGT